MKPLNTRDMEITQLDHSFCLKTVSSQTVQNQNIALDFKAQFQPQLGVWI